MELRCKVIEVYLNNIMLPQEMGGSDQNIVINSKGKKSQHAWYLNSITKMTRIYGNINYHTSHIYNSYIDQFLINKPTMNNYKHIKQHIQKDPNIKNLEHKLTLNS